MVIMSAFQAEDGASIALTRSTALADSRRYFQQVCEEEKWYKSHNYYLLLQVD